MICPDSPHEVHPTLHGFGRTGPEARWDYIAGKTRPAGGGCWTKFCRGTRSDMNRGRICHKCLTRLRRLNNPLTEAFKILRNNARRRGKPFDLTLDQFRQFAEENGYLEGKGRHAGALHIDRKDPLLGYTLGNIRVLESTVNSAKGAIEDKLRHYNHQPLQGDLEDVGF